MERPLHSGLHRIHAGTLGSLLGIAYVYRKTILLAKGKAEMEIAHSLRNTGKAPIDTNVYDHNFLRIDGEAPGPDYTITTPFPITTQPTAEQGLRRDSRESDYLPEDAR